MGNRRFAVIKDKKLREKVAALSSGRYYPTLWAWQLDLIQVLTDFGFTLDNSAPFQVYNDEGKGTLRVAGEEETRVFFTWYRMPSFNWEIVCYLT